QPCVPPSLGIGYPTEVKDEGNGEFPMMSNPKKKPKVPADNGPGRSGRRLRKPPQYLTDYDLTTDSLCTFRLDMPRGRSDYRGQWGRNRWDEPRRYDCRRERSRSRERPSKWGRWDDRSSSRETIGLLQEERHRQSAPPRVYSPPRDKRARSPKVRKDSASGSKWTQ
ncbi:unnamed protein product, partial [Owenia fusiformis]